jgi:hypothetical protein
MQRLAPSRESIKAVDMQNGESTMKTRHIATVFAAALLTVGLIPLGSASEVGGFPGGIEVITVVGKRPALESIEGFAVAPRPLPEGVEVITVVGKRTEPTIASTCVNEVLAAAESRSTRDRVRQSIKECIDRTQQEANHS